MALIAAQERPFEHHELFVFKTDGDGVLRGADPVFVRLCGADPAGRPYAALAEPVPALDRPSATMVKHLAADGAVFWARVFVLPVAGGAVGVGFRPAERSVFVDEVAARRERRLRGNEAVGALREVLGGVGARLAGHSALAATFAGRSEFVAELAEEVRLFSLNAILAAHRVSDAAAIGAVASLMQTRSDAVGPEILALREAIDDAGARLVEARFRAAAGELLAEALLVNPDAPLAAPLVDTTEATLTSAAALEAALDRLADVSASVDRQLKMLRFLELQGRIEAARAHDTEHVRTLFAEIGVHVRKAGDELHDFVALGTRRHRTDGTVGREARRHLAAVRDAG